MRVVVEKITPNRARELIGAAADQPQRHVSYTRVERFAHAIRAGQWMVTHQAIAIDKDGVVFDGQHRLHAIIKADMPVEATIAYDADPGTFAVIDTGAARNAGNTLTIAGYTNAGQTAAIVRLLVGYEAIVGTKDGVRVGSDTVTTLDILKILEGPRGDVIMHAVNESQSIAQTWGRLGVRTWLAVAIVLLRESGLDSGLQGEFLARLRDGAFLRPGSPILSFRRYVQSETGLHRVPSGSERNLVGVATFIKTLNDYLAGTHRTLTVFKPGIEPAPRIKIPSKVSELVDPATSAIKPETLPEDEFESVQV